ncbi:odorant receptor Or1-like [Zophobas morio]|uniref:odorant receptor Or1-like n=1 Tax=Zophobas morio TaxID=2755281 RepID=UPI0030831353
MVQRRTTPHNTQQLVKSIFGVNLLVMRVLGFYPPRKFLSTLYLVTDPNLNLDKVADSAFIICQLGCFIIKMLPFLLNGKEIRESIYMMEHETFVKFTREQEHIIQDCRKMCRRTSYLFLSFCSACLTTWAITPLFEKEPKLPIDVWLPYDFGKNKKLYLISYLYTFAGTGSGALSNGAIDPLIAGMAYFATCQIKILKDNLQHLGKHLETERNNNENPRDAENLKHELIYSQIRNCVYHHNVIIKFVENYENVFSFVVFTQFCASVLVICICCFRLSQMTSFSMSFVWMAIFLCTMLSEIFLYCIYGTTLFEENSTLMQAVHMGKWYEYDQKSKKSLIVLMERSKRPMVVTAGKILDLSLETFTTILRRAYSLLAVLKNY